MGFPGGSDDKESACDVGDPGSIPGSGRSSGEGNGYTLQCSCLENPRDRGPWWARAAGVIYRFLRRQVRWSAIPISKSFPQFVTIHAVKGFSIVNETEVGVFLEFPCFLHDLANVGNLVSGSSACSKHTLYTWKFSIQALLKPSLKDFEHKLTSMGSECKCPVV